MRLCTRVQGADDILIAGVRFSLDDDCRFLANAGKLHHRIAETEDVVLGGAVNDNVVLVLHMQHDVEWYACRRDLGADRWELGIDAFLPFDEGREAHVKNEQDQNRVDHRDDFDAGALHGSSFELHLSSVANVTSSMPALAQTFMNALRSL